MVCIILCFLFSQHLSVALFATPTCVYLLLLLHEQSHRVIHVYVGAVALYGADLSATLHAQPHGEAIEYRGRLGVERGDDSSPYCVVVFICNL